MGWNGAGMVQKELKGVGVKGIEVSRFRESEEPTGVESKTGLCRNGRKEL